MPAALHAGTVSRIQGRVAAYILSMPPQYLEHRREHQPAVLRHASGVLSIAGYARIVDGDRKSLDDPQIEVVICGRAAGWIEAANQVEHLTAECRHARHPDVVA